MRRMGCRLPAPSPSRFGISRFHGDFSSLVTCRCRAGLALQAAGCVKPSGASRCALRFCAVSTNGYNASYTAISMNNGGQRTIGNCASAACRCAKHRTRASQPMVSVAIIENTCVGNRATIALLHQLGSAESCATTVEIQFIEPPDT